MWIKLLLSHPLLVKFMFRMIIFSKFKIHRNVTSKLSILKLVEKWANTCPFFKKLGVMMVELFNNGNLNNVTKEFMNSQGILASILLPVGGLGDDDAFARSVFNSSLMSTSLDCRTLEWLWPMPDDSVLLIVTFTRLCFVTNVRYSVRSQVFKPNNVFDTIFVTFFD